MTTNYLFEVEEKIKIFRQPEYDSAKYILSNILSTISEYNKCIFWIREYLYNPLVIDGFLFHHGPSFPYPYCSCNNKDKKIYYNEN
jgi:hypothetical protein